MVKGEIKKTNPFDPYDPHRFTTVAFETRLAPIEGFLMQVQRYDGIS